MYYFAYGSNMNPDRLRQRGVTFSSRGLARLPGYRLAFDKLASDDHRKGYANVVFDQSATLEGILYTLDAVELDRLDSFEGCPRHYQRHKADVRSIHGDILRAIVYIANPAKVRNGLKPSPDYLAHLLAGRDLLSPGYVAQLAATLTL